MPDHPADPAAQRVADHRRLASAAKASLAFVALLAVMFVMEAVFGPAGLVAAPLFYAYTKKELQASGWV